MSAVCASTVSILPRGETTAASVCRGDMPGDGARQSTSSTSQPWDAEDQALMDNDPANRAIWEALQGKAGKKARMPYMKNKDLPPDIRAGLIAREDARRAGDRPAGKNLPTDAPEAGWVEKQKASVEEQKKARAARKAAKKNAGK